MAGRAAHRHRRAEGPRVRDATLEDRDRRRQWPAGGRFSAPTGSRSTRRSARPSGSSRVEFSVFVGHAEGEPRAFAREPARRPRRPGPQHPDHGRPRRPRARGGHRQLRPPHPPRPRGRAGGRRDAVDCSRPATSSAGCAAASRCSPSTPARRRPCTRDRSDLMGPLLGILGVVVVVIGVAWCVLPVARRGAGAGRRGRGTPAAQASSRRSRRSPGPTATSRPSCPRSSSTRSGPRERSRPARELP